MEPWFGVASNLKLHHSSLSRDGRMNLRQHCYAGSDGVAGVLFALLQNLRGSFTPMATLSLFVISVEEARRRGKKLATGVS